MKYAKATLAVAYLDNAIYLCGNLSRWLEREQKEERNILKELRASIVKAQKIVNKIV